MRDRSLEGFRWLLATLPFAFVAVGSQNPWVKFGTALGAIYTTAKAGECFQDTAKYSYYQLKQASEPHQLQQSY